MNRLRLFLVAAASAGGLAGQGLAGQDLRSATPADTTTLMALFRAEDARGRDNGMATILGALKHEDDRMRRLALRSVGRLERPNLVSALAPLLRDQVAIVRIEAAHAIAQSVFRGNANVATRELVGRLEIETDEGVRAALIEALGRLPHTETDRFAEAESAMLRHSAGANPSNVPAIARGWDSFTRRASQRYEVSAATLELLDSFTLYAPSLPARTRNRETFDAEAADVREIGLNALVAAGGIHAEQIARGLADQSWEVRRAAAAAIGRIEETPDRGRYIGAALADPHPNVRTEALRLFTRSPAETRPCGPLLGATADSVTNVAIAAIDLLAGGCDDPAGAVARLTRLADGPITAEGWHLPAHALVSLASLDQEAARSRLLAFSEQDNWWVRMYAARAAGVLQATGLLEQLAFDDRDNVREAAIRGLVAVAGREADPVLLANLNRPDYQLILTIARSLEGTTHPQALPLLFETLFRITAEGRETSRDPRKAIVDRISELGNASAADALSPYLRDYDPLIATTVSAILERWTGDRLEAYPTPRPAFYPELADLRRLDGMRVTFHMQRGGAFTIRLFAFDAPTNVVRFAILALNRHFEGLTFHRVVPNFVIQGGSPHANEYMGDGPFTNDEITRRPHSRGTVGLSTRGRDTADSQLFVNLVDNRRLDHNYTIIAEVIRGMDVIDDIVEGDVIARVEVGR